MKKTYDIFFNDSENTNNKGFNFSIDEAYHYIIKYNCTNESYVKDYKGGTI